ncbi:BTAD domain-containing putative transcriptional regulator [Spongiactinospora sp. TRM90649]|uniref:BTAD domain-containing putative transcriptional regulator n=1 Tax=Spongiactinospora sp. TRM90649 TaxID=3031114 RepID=UPI0023F6E240|nr:BTAD domain-containing putative transcriptional regulator [Spongiactinospora sp. TRM90649]MDF5756584.1 BTAD domain-containing putative transcriptional regulator [Spongiactinospora sp. TRM90649]
MLCALLALHDRGLSGAELAEGVWGDDHGRDGAVKTVVSELRRLLPGRIPPGGSAGYRIVLGDDDALDLTEFRRLVTAAEGASEAVVRAHLLGRAVELLGDPPVPDMPDDSSLLRGVRDELLRQHRDARLELVQTLTSLGRHRDALTAVRRALQDDPLSEALHAALMDSLYRAGDRVDALRHYDAFAVLLRRETGSDPGGRLRRLHDDIAADVLHEPRPAATPDVIATRRVIPAQLPADLPDFVGRLAEITAILTHVPASGAAVPVINITGMPGVGKTALAVHLGHRVRRRFPDGQIFVHLGAMSGRPVAVGEALAEQLVLLGVPAADIPASTAGRSALLRSVLADRKVLLVIDDVASAAQGGLFVPGTPGCAVLITSRPRLSGPGIRSMTLDPLRRDEARHLLAELIGADRIDAEPSAADAILDACADLPLALRIAAGRLTAHPHWPIGLLATRLHDRLAGLTDGDVAVSASIADSYDALSEQVRHALRVLSLAGSGSWPMWLADMLIGKGDGEDALAALNAHNLVLPAGADAHGHPRYRMHDLVREYAERRLADRPDERDVATHRLLTGWLLLADRAAAATPGEPWFAPPSTMDTSIDLIPEVAWELVASDPEGWLTAEATQIFGVIRMELAERRFRLAFGIALRISAHLNRSGRSRDAEDMWRVITRIAVETGDDRLGAQARLRAAALVAATEGGPLRAVPMLNDCAEVLQRLVDRRSWARALALRAHCRHEMAQTAGENDPGLLAQAEQDARMALTLAQTAGDDYAEVASLRTLVLIEHALGRTDEAATTCQTAVETGREISTRRGDRTYEQFAASALSVITA